MNTTNKDPVAATSPSQLEPLITRATAPAIRGQPKERCLRLLHRAARTAADTLYLRRPHAHSGGHLGDGAQSKIGLTPQRPDSAFSGYPTIATAVHSGAYASITTGLKSVIRTRSVPSTATPRHQSNTPARGPTGTPTAHAQRIGSARFFSNTFLGPVIAPEMNHIAVVKVRIKLAFLLAASLGSSAYLRGSCSSIRLFSFASLRWA